MSFPRRITSVAPSVPPVIILGIDELALYPVNPKFGNARGTNCGPKPAGNPSVPMSNGSLNADRKFDSRVYEYRTVPSKLGLNVCVSSTTEFRRPNVCGPVPGDAGLSAPYGAARMNGESSAEYRAKNRFFSLK